MKWEQADKIFLAVDFIKSYCVPEKDIKYDYSYTQLSSNVYILMASENHRVLI